MMMGGRSHRRLTLSATHIAHSAPAAGDVVDYRNALQLLSPELQAVAQTAEIQPHWLSDSRFWYTTATRAVPRDHSTAAQLAPEPHGSRFVLVDPCGGAPTRGPAFDHKKLAEGLSAASKRPIDADALPFSHISFEAGDTEVHFSFGGERWICELEGYTVHRSKEDAAEEQLSLPVAEIKSPDGRYSAFVEAHNIWLRDTVSGERIQLSTSGCAGYDYAKPLVSPDEMISQGTEHTRTPPALRWSPDGRWIATAVLDTRGCPTLTMVDSAPPEQFRPKAYEYHYPLPGDYRIPSAVQPLPPSPPSLSLMISLRAINHHTTYIPLYIITNYTLHAAVVV